MNVHIRSFLTGIAALLLINTTVNAQSCTEPQTGKPIIAVIPVSSNEAGKSRNNFTTAEAIVLAEYLNQTRSIAVIGPWEAKSFIEKGGGNFSKMMDANIKPSPKFFDQLLDRLKNVLSSLPPYDALVAIGPMRTDGVYTKMVRTYKLNDGFDFGIVLSRGDIDDEYLKFVQADTAKMKLNEFISEISQLLKRIEKDDCKKFLDIDIEKAEASKVFSDIDKKTWGGALLEMSTILNSTDSFIEKAQNIFGGERCANIRKINENRSENFVFWNDWQARCELE